ncbi:MAG: protein O-mannosyl-transferase family [Candidatus Eiseniibacteriota bacterium]
MTSLPDSLSTSSEARPAGAPRVAAAAAARSYDLANRIVAGAVGLSIFSVYVITLSPDVSFWDSGEFIATSHAMGIPHPPGTPLYVLMGRVFSLLFHGLLGVASPAQAVNLLSALPSAIAAVFLYLCVVRVGKRLWNDGVQSTFCLPATIAGATAAIFAAFSNTLWIDSIEAEVYAVSGMWAVFTTWLVLLWADSEPRDERLLVVTAYLLSLNIGVHLATYLAALAILPFAFLHERRIAIPVSFAVVLAMAKDLQFFLVVVGLLILTTLQLALLPAAYRERYRWTLMLAHGVAVLLAVWAVTSMTPSALRNLFIAVPPLVAFFLPVIALPVPKKLENPFTDLGFLLGLVTVLGFTCHLYLPIRSALDPAINEAQPDNWDAFWKLILRDQYKPTSVLDRQATWVYQFDHMFWRYLREQWSPAFLALLAVPGVLVHLRRDRRTFVLFGLLFLWTSAALVFKMNFTDQEVRERDYFFAPGFFYFAVWMGLGLGWLSSLVMSGVSAPLRRGAGLVTAGVCVFIAGVPMARGWESHDRRGNWIANDYAYNMLAGLEQDAVLFTNGDNDTFPLWYLQEVEGFRKDVRIVNLSLLNTPWYGEQIRDQEPRVPMSLTTEQLWELTPFRDSNTGKVWYVKDIVGTDIVQTIRRQGNQRPLYFAVTVDDLLGFDDEMHLEGLVFRVAPSRGATALSTDDPELGTAGAEIAGDVNLSATRRNLEEVYRYRGLLDESGKLDPTVYRDENEQKLVTNYAAAWARMAIAYRDRGDMDQALACIRRAIDIAPHYDPIVGGLGGMLLESGQLEEAQAFYRERLRTHPEDVRVYLGLALAAGKTEKWEEALEWYLEGLRLAPESRELLAGLFETCRRLGRWTEAENVLVQWLNMHPGDHSARAFLEDIRRQRQAAESSRAAN